MHITHVTCNEAVALIAEAKRTGLDLTAPATNAQNQVAGPFRASIPAPPSGWSAYGYTAESAVGVFTISAAGDATTVRIP